MSPLGVNSRHDHADVRLSRSIVYLHVALHLDRRAGRSGMTAAEQQGLAHRPRRGSLRDGAAVRAPTRTLAPRAISGRGQVRGGLHGCCSARRVSLKAWLLGRGGGARGRLCQRREWSCVAFFAGFRRREASQAVWRRCWWSFWRLWAAARSRHSDLTADRPRREKRRKPRLLLIWPNTGSTMPWRFR
jgi:hypothetical protein